MNSVIAWFAQNRVAANLLMFLILIAGIITLPQTRKEFLPNYSLNTITVTVPYLGASPNDIEKSIVDRVESAISDLSGIASVKSVAAEGFGSVTAEVAFGYQSRRVLEDIKARIESISNFPLEAGKPIVIENKLKSVVSKIMISGPADERTLRTVAEKLRNDLLDLSEITQVEISDVRPHEIAVEVDERSLQRYGISFAEVAQAVRMSSVDYPGGILWTQNGGINVRTEAQVYRPEDFEKIVLRALPDGGRVRIADVAEVKDQFVGKAQVRFNGQPAVSLSISRVGNEDIMEIADALEGYLQSPRFYIPEEIKLTLWQDMARLVKSRLDLLAGNAISGLILVFALLLLFLRSRLALWVSFGIPVAFLGTLALVPYFDVSINMISMFGFILVLGIVVDDAIVVGESIYSQHQKGVFGHKGAVKGAIEVYKPVVFATLTTIIAFMPMLFVSGIQGRLAREIPIVVIVALLVSLLECLFILPAHLAEISTLNEKRGLSFLKSVQNLFSRSLQYVVDHVYRPLLERALIHRYVCLAFFVACYLIALGLLQGGWLGLIKDTEIEAENINAAVAFPSGTPIKVTRNAIEEMEKAILEIRGELEDETGIDQIMGIQTAVGILEQENVGFVNIGLLPNENRRVQATEVARRWRERVGNLGAGAEVSFEATQIYIAPHVNFQLTGQNIETLRKVADALKKKLSEIPGVHDIHDTLEQGKQEILLSLKPSGRDLGLSENALAQQVRQTFYGIVAQTIHKSNEEIQVFVRYPLGEKNTLWHLENMPLRLPTGDFVPLINVADVRFGTAPVFINRIDGRRVLNVIGMVDDTQVDPQLVLDNVNRTFIPEAASTYKGVNIEVAGQLKSQSDYKAFLLKGFLLSVLGMYILMAVLFKSYIQPLLVMTAIPFGQIGALLGHMFFGVEISLWSFVGMVAGSGVVVNDNLVMIDYINRMRLEGASVYDAIKSAGAVRFRPIILTSLTTFAGLVPLVLERSWQAQFLKPMAVSLGCGVMFATLLTLFLVPSLYLMLEDLRHWFTNKRLQVRERISQQEKAELGMDDAYQQGYSHGLSGHPDECPLDSEVLSAAWEAGWADGNEEFSAKH